MFKSPSRNQRSKGLKIKNVLQIFLLLGVCFWLIYQVKHSHNKKKEFDEKDARVSVKTQSDNVIVKFGRRDLPHMQQISTNYKHEGEEEEETGGEEENRHEEEKDKSLEEEEQGAIKHEEEEQGAIKHEEEEQEEVNKHEEEEQEEASKHEGEEQEEVQEDDGSKHDHEGQEAEIKDEETEEEGRGVGDDEVDENEQERADGEADREEEFIDEEKEREAEGDGRENEEKEAEEKEGQEEGDNLGNDENHDGSVRNAQVAREEHYKADDASSAVSHDSQITNTEADKVDVENSNDNLTMNNLEQESKADKTEETNSGENKSGLKIDERRQSEGGSSVTNSGYISLPHATAKTDFIDQASNNSRELIKETGNKPVQVNLGRPGSLQNGAATDLKSTSTQNTAVDGLVAEEKHKEQANETISNSEQANSNGVSSSKTEIVDSATQESLNSSINTESGSGLPKDITMTDETTGTDSSASFITRESADSSQNEKSEGDNESGGTDENQNDPIDSSDNTLPEEEKDAQVDLGTLPDLTIGGINNEDAAAE